MLPLLLVCLTTPAVMFARPHRSSSDSDGGVEERKGHDAPSASAGAGAPSVGGGGSGGKGLPVFDDGLPVPRGVFRITKRLYIGCVGAEAGQGVLGVGICVHCGVVVVGRLCSLRAAARVAAVSRASRAIREWQASIV